jgi:hypothetical protein
LGEFSPIGRLFSLGSCFLWEVVFFGQLFSLGSFLKIIKAAQLLCLHGNIYVFVLTKNGLGYILGDFFTNSSGHPARVRKSVRTYVQYCTPLQACSRSQTFHLYAASAKIDKCCIKSYIHIPGLPDFSKYNIAKQEKYTKITK